MKSWQYLTEDVLQEVYDRSKGGSSSNSPRITRRIPMRITKNRLLCIKSPNKRIVLSSRDAPMPPLVMEMRKPAPHVIIHVIPRQAYTCTVAHGSKKADAAVAAVHVVGRHVAAPHGLLIWEHVITAHVAPAARVASRLGHAHECRLAALATLRQV